MHTTYIKLSLVCPVYCAKLKPSRLTHSFIKEPKRRPTPRTKRLKRNVPLDYYS